MPNLLYFSDKFVYLLVDCAGVLDSGDIVRLVLVVGLDEDAILLLGDLLDLLGHHKRQYMSRDLKISWPF